MAEESAAPATPAAPAARDFLGKAEAAIGDMHKGTLKGSEPDILEQEIELEDDLGGEPAPDAELGDDEIVDAEPSIGSEESPYTVKTLPDAYVTIKVDGEERTVSMREMADGYMRESAFHKRVGEVQELKKQAHELVEVVKTERNNVRAAFRDLIQQPEEMYAFLDDHAEETLDKIARMRLRLMLEWQNNPAARVEHERAKHQARLDKERKKFEDEQKSYRTERAQREATERYKATFEPGYKQGMREAGYPKITDEFRTLVNGILNATRASGVELTGDHVRQAVVRAARITQAETVQDRKPMPPKAQPGRTRQPVPQRGAAPAKSKSFRDIFKDLGK